MRRMSRPRAMIISSVVPRQARTGRASRLVAFGTVIVIAAVAAVGWYAALIYLVIRAGLLVYQIALN